MISITPKRRAQRDTTRATAASGEKPVRGIRPTSPAQRCPFLSPVSFGHAKEIGKGIKKVRSTFCVLHDTM